MDLVENSDLNKQASKKQKQTTAISNSNKAKQRGQVGKMYFLGNPVAFEL